MNIQDKKWKGILLAGGSGTRLYPLTLRISKQLMPVYDKPMIYYPISVLLMAGIQEIAIVSTPHDLPLYRDLLGDGSQWGCHFEFIEQARPEGIAQAFLLAENFIGDSSVCLVLGDNIFFGQGFGNLIEKAKSRASGATVFGYHVVDPERYGVVSFDENKKAINIEEKPIAPKSNYAITGLYFYDNTVVEIAKTIKASHRKELEITDVNNIYLKQKALHVEVMGRGIAWLDTGTHDSLLSAANFVQAVQLRQGLKVCCPEEIAWEKKYITSVQLKKLAEPLSKTDYGQYLLDLASS